MTLNRKTLTGGALALIAVLFVAVVLLSNLLFRGARLDLTEHKLYTLSEGTRNILGNLDEPLNLTLYFSDKATADSNRPDIRALRVYFNRVHELLEEMAARAGGKLRLTLIDPLPYSEDEDRAAAAGIQGLPLGPSGEKVSLGLVGTNATDGQAVIAFFDPGKESFLEYDVAKLIHDLAAPKKLAVGLVSGLPLAAGFDPMTRSMREPWGVYQELSQLFEVKELDGSTLKAVDKDIGVLVVVHPKQLNDDAQYAIDQFVLRGGHLLAFVDPNAELDTTGADPSNPHMAMLADKSSDLPALFKAWGVEYTPDQVVLDRTRAVPVGVAPGAPPVRHPGIIGLKAPDLNRDDIVTANLESINVASAGYFKLVQGSALKLVPLFESSAQSMTAPAQRVKLVRDPTELWEGFTPTGARYTIAARLQGTFKTAFPDRQGEGHLTEAKEPGLVVLVADTDLLSDRMWVRVQNFFGQNMMNAFANNGDFFVNAVDNLTGSTDLISIRGRATSQRPFTKVEELKQAADDRFRDKERELQKELTDTERKLAELQTGKSRDEALVLSPEQKAGLEQFLKRKLEIRKELREVRRQLDSDIEALGAWLKFINIALIPILLTFGAVGYVWWNARQRAH
ncbi:Gldg family protein [Methylolobus aquaticus]